MTNNVFCLFTFRPIALKHLNSLTAIDTFSWLGGLEVTHQDAVTEVPCSCSCSGKDIHVIFCVLLLWVILLLFFVKNTLFVTKFWRKNCNINSFWILNIMLNLWPIMLWSQTIYGPRTTSISSKFVRLYGARTAPGRRQDESYDFWSFFRHRTVPGEV